MRADAIDMTLRERRAPVPHSALRDQLAAEGYAVLDETLDEALLDRLVGEVRAKLKASPFDFSINGTPFYGERILRGVSMTAKCPCLLEVLALPVIQRVMEASMLDHCNHALLSAATALEISNQGVAKPQPFHRDENVYSAYLPRVPGGAEYTVNIMIAGTEFTEENGATLLVPGSNRWPADRLPTSRDPVVQLLMPRGGLGVWVGSAFHGAGVNRTTSPRLGIILSFCLGWLRTLENMFIDFNADNVRDLPAQVQRLLGFDAHGMSLGVHDGASPMRMWGAA